jgi:coatomer subunit beta
MLIMASVLHLGKSGLPAQPIDPDSYERIIKSLRVLAEPSDLTTEIFVKVCVLCHVMHRGLNVV